MSNNKKERKNFYVEDYREDISAYEWFNENPELFNNEDFIKNMLEKLEKVESDMYDLTNYYENHYVKGKNPYGTPYFYDARKIHRNIEKWINKFLKIYNKLESNKDENSDDYEI